MARVTIAPGSEKNGFAQMMSSLIEQNAADDPGKGRSLARLRGRIAIIVTDAKVSITLQATSHGVTVHSGIVGIPDLTIKATSANITKMSHMELLPRVPLPNLRGKVASEIMKASQEHDIEVFGALKSPATLIRLNHVLNVTTG